MSRKIEGDNETTRFYRLAGPRPADPDECWIWPAWTSRDGYGKMKADAPGRTGGPTSKMAHRASYEIHVGPIPEGLSLDHVCRNSRCVNPRHLEPVTASDNMRRIDPDKCRAGHPRTPENTRITKDGHRVCRVCHRGWQRKHLEKKAAREALGG